MAQIEAVVAEIHARGGRAFAVRADVADEAAVLDDVRARACPARRPRRPGQQRRHPDREAAARNHGRGFRPADRGQSARRVPGRARGAARHGPAAARAASSTSPPSSPISAARTARSIARPRAASCAMTRSWAREFAPNILVNAIAPGPTDTAMLTGGSTSPETLAKEAQIPLAGSAVPRRSRAPPCSWPGRARRSSPGNASARTAAP